MNEYKCPNCDYIWKTSSTGAPPCPICGETLQRVPDPVNHPTHYTSHPSGVECIVVTEHMSFCVGNAVKYLWRAGKKGPVLEDLRKARWYIDREIVRQESMAQGQESATLDDTPNTCDALEPHDPDESPTRPDIPSLRPPPSTD